MNHIYRLVWNPALRTTQVAPEIARNRSGGAGNTRPLRRGRASRAAIRTPQVLALAGLIGAALPAWAATCTPGATAACSAPGGTGSGNRGGPGGAGNGQGGGSSILVGPDTVPATGGESLSDGTGGTGHAGDTAPGGTGGTALSAASPLAILGSQTGGAGANGSSGFNFASGGGGGGAGVYMTGPSLNVGPAATLTGGRGGNGGDGTSGIVSDAGGGGGGGAALISMAPSTSITNEGTIVGGAGGNGGNGGFGGGGGGGGDGMLVLGASNTIINIGTIRGGLGGLPGTNISGNGNTAGSGGAGIHLANVGNIVMNAGTIAGANSTGSGAGIGIIASDQSVIVNSGTIVGGLNSDGITRAAAIRFSGAASHLSLQAGSVILGEIALENGASATIAEASSRQPLNNAITLGSGSALTLTDLGAGLTVSGNISGSGSVTIGAAGAVTLTGANHYTGGTTIAGGTLQLGNGGTSGSIAGDVVNNGTLVFNRSDSTNFGGAISGTGALQKSGSGTLTLSSGNTYTGSTTIAAGTLALSGAGTLGTGDVIDHGVLDISAASVAPVIGGLAGTGAVVLGSRTLTTTGTAGAFGGVLSGTGGIQVNSGTLTLSGQNSYTGLTAINGGTLAVVGNGRISSTSGVVNDGTFDLSAANADVSLTRIGGSGNVVLGANTLTLTQANGTLSGSVSGTGGLTIGGGTQTLSGQNTYSGDTTIQGGTLALSGSGSAANSRVVNHGTLDIAATTAGAAIRSLSGSGVVNLGDRTLTVTGAGDDFGGVVAGTGGVTVSGGTQTLSGINTFSGTTTIQHGTLAFTGNGSAAASRVVNQGTLDISGTANGTTLAGLSGSGTVNLGSRTLTLTHAADTFAGTMSGSGGLTLAGGTLTLTGANTYTGATTVGAATLALSGAGALSRASAVVLDDANAVLDISAAGDQAVGGITGVAGSRVIMGARALALDVGDSETLDSSLSGSGDIVKRGVGSLTLNGVSTAYTGTATIAEGMLKIGDANTPSAVLGGNVVVDALGTLRGHGTVMGDVTNNGIVMPGGSIGTLTVGGNYQQAANGTLTIQVSPVTGSQLRVAGTASLDGGLAVVYEPGTYSARRYTVLTAGNGVTGRFATLSEASQSGARLGNLQAELAYDTNAVDLVLAASGALAPQQTSIYTAQGSAALLRAQFANAALLDRAAIDTQRTGTGRGVWATTTASRTSVGGANGQPGYQAHQYGFLAGFDQAVGAGSGGIAAGYTHTSLGEDGTGSSGNSDTLRLAVYGDRWLGPVGWSTTAGYGISFLSQKRPFGAVGSAEGDHTGHEFTAATQLRLPLSLGDFVLTPRAGLRYAYFHGRAFGEHGAAGQNLSVDTDNARSLQPFAGLTLDRLFDGARTPAKLQLRAGYAREVLGRSRALTVTALDGTAFVASGTSLPRSYLTAGVGISVNPSKALTLTLGFDAMFNTGGASTQSGHARVDYRF